MDDVFRRPPLLIAGHMARRLHVTVRWLKAEADAGRIPHLKAENTYLFDEQSVVDVLVKRAKEGVTQKALSRGEDGGQSKL